MIQRLEAAEMWFIRRMLRISWTEKRTNEYVLAKANRIRTLITTLRKRQMKFVGHIVRNPGLEEVAMLGMMCGKREKGRQRLTYLQSLSNWATDGKTKEVKMKEMARNRTVWRNMISDVCIRYGT